MEILSWGLPPMKALRITAADLDRALERGEFSLVFQPKLRLTDFSISGCEAYLRWQHPLFGLMAPGMFLAFVEAQGRAKDLARIVLRDALAAARQWQAHGHDWHVSVNVSTADLADPAFPALAREALADSGVVPSRLVIETPEHAVAQRHEQAFAQLEMLRAMGIGIALDGPCLAPLDLDSMGELPFTEVKVSGAAILRFSAAVRRWPRGGAIPMRIAAAAKRGLMRTAVGIEEPEVAAALAAIGFDCGQGLALGRPMRAEEVLGYVPPAVAPRPVEARAASVPGAGNAADAVDAAATRVMAPDAAEGPDVEGEDDIAIPPGPGVAVRRLRGIARPVAVETAMPAVAEARGNGIKRLIFGA